MFELRHLPPRACVYADEDAAAFADDGAARGQGKELLARNDAASTENANARPIGAAGEEIDAALRR